MQEVAGRVLPETCIRMISKTRSKDTGPELAVRRTLRGAGLRRGIPDRTLPGTPTTI